MRGVATLAVVVLTACTLPSLVLAQQQQGRPVVSRADYEEVLRDIDNNEVFQKFLNKLPTITVGDDVQRTYYIIEGDLRLTREEVRARLRPYVSGTQTAEQASRPVGSSSSELNVMTSNGVAAIWPRGRRALTYAIDRGSFPAGTYEIVVRNMAEAANAWVQACPECELSFEHRAQHDSNPRLDQVTFIVRYWPNELRYYAVAFFPNDPVDQRYLHIMQPYFSSDDQLGVLTHEIGHVLGYRHAHINGVPGCELWEERDRNWVAISEYYADSVMHYACGRGPKKFVLSEHDKADHRKLYGTR